ncbi:male-enhanced antigen 1 [Solea solea]|uniref:male-enhanced antigen 1 n=1 Tax=Solea solea TaxID=90069 RepID=UPI00272BF935|nr:male-enhanced antigen 1 [Solea solea]XP_058506989.1 male-enhanced antigen 1 [Solea solea]
MEVCSATMGPERVLPSSEDELGEERPIDGATPPPPAGGAAWSGGEGGGEEDEGEEEENNGGYYYQPLNQEPEGDTANEDRGAEQEEEQEREAAPSHVQQLQVQQRIEVMGLHLPEAPPPDSDEDDDPEGAAALRSRASIPMDADHVELVKRTMAAVALPTLGVPAWAREISDDQWKDMVENTLQSHQSAGAVRLGHRLSNSNNNGP